MVGWPFPGALDMIDPCRHESLRKAGVGRQQVDSHTQVAGVVEPMVPPCEAPLSWTPSAGVEVDEAAIDPLVTSPAAGPELLLDVGAALL